MGSDVLLGTVRFVAPSETYRPVTLPRSIHQVRENRASIQDLLDREWYPVAKAPSRADFEIWCAMLLLHLTDAETSERDVADYLLDLAISELGLNASMRVRDRCREAARSLLAMRGQFYEH
jgi:hypothetical protein